MIWPVSIATVTQEFGANPAPFQPDGHTGMDFGVPRGTPIRAAAAGTVLWADWAQGLGWPNPYFIAIDFDGPWNGDQSAGIVIIIDHGPGKPATVYGHCDQTGLSPGDMVRAGEIIGQTGNTGRSTGPHLHFEVLPDGWDVTAKWFGRVNPRNVLGERMTVIDESLTAKGFTPAAQVPGVWGLGPRRIEGVVIHHWGAFGQTHNGVVNFFVNGPGSTSAHFVVSAGRIHCLVSPGDAAWHAGNALGNVTQIGIECRPEASAGDYETAAELIRWLRGQYGDLPLTPHRNWQATACPGIWDLPRLDAMARTTAAPPPPPPPTDWFDMATRDDLKAALREVLMEPGILDAQSLHQLKRACFQVDPTGVTDAVTGTTNVAETVNVAKHDHAQILSGLAALSAKIDAAHPAP